MRPIAVIVFTTLLSNFLWLEPVYAVDEDSGSGKHSAVSHEDITPEMRTAIEYGIVTYVQRAGGSLGMGVTPPRPSDHLIDKLRKYSDVSFSIEMRAVTSKLDASANTIDDTGYIKIKLEGSLQYNLMFSGGTVGIRTGEVFVSDGTKLRVNNVLYIAKNNLWQKTTDKTTGPVTDIDGNVYQTVTIGTQVWMKENLKVTHYRNGEAIPNVTDSTDWEALTTGAYCEYNNDVNNVATYGRLYNWYAVSDSRNIAPAGWHVPTDADWQTLIDFLEGDAVAGGEMKEAGFVHWVSPNTGATNGSGFSLLPGGYRSGSGDYDSLGQRAYFWSSTEDLSESAWCRHLGYDYSVVGRSHANKALGFSVYCVKDNVPVLTTAAVSAITQTTAMCGGTITSDGGAMVTARGVCWSTNPTPTVTDSRTTDGVGIDSFTSSITGLTVGTLYYVRAYASNGEGTGYGSIISLSTTDSVGTMTDIDANTYRTVKIGNQWWMAENLKVTHYRNGEAIPNVTDSTDWEALTTGAHCEYNNDVNNVATYGRLYNWYAVSDSRNIAPAGWHVPTDAEWKQLEMALGMSQSQADVAGIRITAEGGKLKAVGTAHWDSPNTGATNESGFSAMPGGERAGRAYYNVGEYGNFWSSTVEAFFDGSALYRYMYYRGSYIARNYEKKAHGCSVRCVRD